LNWCVGLIYSKVEETALKNRLSSSYALALGLLVLSGAVLIGCGGKLEGTTYAGNGGVVQVEFKSGGKAYVSTGPVSTPCTYTESGKTVTLVCEGDKTIFTMDDDGALNGPQGGMLGRLTKKKQ
jgi:hypothetical protein